MSLLVNRFREIHTKASFIGQNYDDELLTSFMDYFFVRIFIIKSIGVQINSKQF